MQDQPREHLQNSPVILVLGPQALCATLAQTGAQRGSWRAQRVANLHAAAAQVAAARSLVAGVMLDVSACTQRDVAAIRIFRRAGVTVWIIGQERKPSRGADALAQGALPWTAESEVAAPRAPQPSVIAPAVIAPAVIAPVTAFAPQPQQSPQKSETSAAPEPIQTPAESVELEANSPADPHARYDEMAAAPLVSEEELRALLGVVE